MRSRAWPPLPLDAWKDTYATLHMWTQIVGKIRMSRCAWVNHSWGVTL
jgi:predicted 3-demethylubiquinone-9 3-methyltransferase (glyoxalase superfamily)